MRWDRATPMALIGSMIEKMSAIGVARSQRKSLLPGSGALPPNIKTLWMLALACAIGGSVSEPSWAQSTQTDVDALGSAYIGCLARAAATYDDRRSDATVIRVKVNNACRAEFDRWLQNRAKGLTADEKRQFLDSMQRRGPQIAADVVLKVRAGASQ